MTDSTLGQIGGGIVGAVALAPFGFSAAGFAVGSAIGGSLFAETQRVTGPRRDDLKVQTSSYGKPLPILYGTTQVAGNIIWLKNDQLTEKSETEEVGGKGGGGQKRTTFTYFATFAVSIANNEIKGIRRIWADADLIYDVGDNATASTLFEQLQLDVEGEGGGATLYPGTLTQEPDSRIEADKGNAPAYRGTAYIVFEDLPLQDYGNRIPSIRVEAIAATPSDDRPVLIESNTIAWPELVDDQLNNVALDVRFDGDSIRLIVNQLNGDSDNGALSSSSSGLLDLFEYQYSVDGQRLDRGSTTLLAKQDNSTNVFLGRLSGLEVMGPAFNESSIDEDRTIRGYGRVFNQDGTVSGVLLKTFEASDPTNDNIFLAGAITPDQKRIVIVERDETGSKVFRYRIYNENDLDVPESSGEIVDGAVGWTGLAEPRNPNTSRPLAIEDDAKRIWSIDTGAAGGIRATLLELNGDGDFEAVAETVFSGSTSPISVAANRGIAVLFFKDQFRVLSAAPLQDAQSTPLQTIVEDVASRAGLAANEIDATALSDDVRGYRITRVSPMRQVLGQLKTVFPFDAIPDGYQIRFAPRGQSSVATLTDEDLSAREQGQDQPPIVAVERQLETELPRRVHLTYEDFDRDYEAGEQYAGRITTESERIAQEDLPIVLTGDEAAEVADVQLRLAWAQQESLRAVATWEQLALQPGDVVTLDTTKYSGTARIQQVDDGRPGLIKLSLVPDDPGFYDSSAVGDTSDVVPQLVSVGGPTISALMNLPKMQDNDPKWVWYAAASGTTPTWPGYTLFRVDANDDLSAVFSATQAVTAIGSTTDALADGPTSIFDRSNTVNVSLTFGSLESRPEIDVLNNKNVLAIEATSGGYEIIGFADATLESDGTYTLSTMLRGRFGTEDLTDKHETNARVVLLDTKGGTRAVESSQTALQSDQTYRTVTARKTTNDGTDKTFEYIARDRKPYSPTHVRSSIDGGELVIAWARRARLDNKLLDGLVVPLDEPTEEYELRLTRVSDGQPLTNQTVIGQSELRLTTTEQIDLGIFKNVDVEVEVRQISTSLRADGVETKAKLAGSFYSSWSEPLLLQGTLLGQSKIVEAAFAGTFTTGQSFTIVLEGLPSDQITYTVESGDSTIAGFVSRVKDDLIANAPSFYQITIPDGSPQTIRVQGRVGDNFLASARTGGKSLLRATVRQEAAPAQTGDSHIVAIGFDDEREKSNDASVRASAFEDAWEHRFSIRVTANRLDLRGSIITAFDDSFTRNDQVIGDLSIDENLQKSATVRNSERDLANDGNQLVFNSDDPPNSDDGLVARGRCDFFSVGFDKIPMASFLPDNILRRRVGGIKGPSGFKFSVQGSVTGPRSAAYSIQPYTLQDPTRTLDSPVPEITGVSVDQEDYENSVDTGRVLTINVNGSSFSYTIQSGDALVDITDGLISAVNAGSEPVTAERADPDPNFIPMHMNIVADNTNDPQDITVKTETAMTVTGSVIQQPSIS